MIGQARWVPAPSSQPRTDHRRARGDPPGNGESDISTVRTTPDDDVPFQVALVSLADSSRPGCVVASVTGELDAASNPLLQQSLLRALRQAERELVLDLSGVTFFGSAGVTALVWVSQHPEAAGKHVRVVATSRIVTGPLELTGLLDRLDVTGMPTAGPDDEGGPGATRPPG